MSGTFSQDQAALLRAHLQAQLNVEFFTIPFYLAAVYSFTDAALDYQEGKSYPLYDLQQQTLSVAVQEMYHLQEACNLANAFQTSPTIAPSARTFPAGVEITVPHLVPGGPLKTMLGNLPAVITAMIEVEQPDPNPKFPPPNAAVQYPAISDLYHATLTLIAAYMQAYRLTPAALDPHFTPNNKQVAYGAFATRYLYNKIATREDFLQAANAIADQGEGREIIPKGSGDMFTSGKGCDIADPYLPAKGSRFYAYDLTTHYCRFEAIQKALNATPWATKVGKPIFYAGDGTKSPDLPAHAPSYETCQQSLNTIWSYLTDVMMTGFQQGSLGGGSAPGPGFDSAMVSFKYTIPLIWQHGYCPSFTYSSGVTATQAQAAMDAVDPLCLYHWDAQSQIVRKQFPKNACQGLNACKGQGWGGVATEKGNGACATADFHTCQGSNSCSLQGGCGFLSSVADGQKQKLLPGSEQWIPGENQGPATGGCQTPIAAAQVFNSGADISAVTPTAAQTRLKTLKGTSVWKEARALFQQRESIASLPPLKPVTQHGINYDGTARRNAVTATSKS